MSVLDDYKTAYARENKARLLTEKLLEDKTRDLYDSILHLEGIASE